MLNCILLLLAQLVGDRGIKYRAHLTVIALIIVHFLFFPLHRFLLLAAVVDRLKFSDAIN